MLLPSDCTLFNANPIGGRVRAYALKGEINFTPSGDLGVMYVRTANSKQDTAGSKTTTMMLCFALHICIGLSVCLSDFLCRARHTYLRTYVCAIGFTWYTLRSGATCLRTCACRCIYRTVGMYVGNNVPIYAIELSNTHTPLGC